jgi:hypothetical protein
MNETQIKLIVDTIEEFIVDIINDERDNSDEIDYLNRAESKEKLIKILTDNLK